MATQVGEMNDMEASFEPGRAEGVRCYSVRRVNPFRGVQQVIDCPVGRATSVDGLHWDLAINTDKPRVLGPIERDATGRSFIRIGLWSAAGGHVIAMSRKILERDEELYGKGKRMWWMKGKNQPEAAKKPRKIKRRKIICNIS